MQPQWAFAISPTFVHEDMYNDLSESQPSSYRGVTAADPRAVCSLHCSVGNDKGKGAINKDQLELFGHWRKRNKKFHQENGVISRL